MKERIGLKRWHIISAGALLLSVIVLIISILAIICLPSVIESGIRKASVLTEDSQLLELWKDPLYSIKTSMWTFSVRNPDDVMNDSTPIVKRMGPYVFDQKLKRKIHSIENGTLKYESFRYYFFNEADSCEECFLYNRIWIPNLIFQKFVEAASRPAMRAATAALIVQTPFLEVDVSELLFEGYADPFLDQVCAIPFVNFVCESVLNLPERIGLFFQKNGTSSGVFEVQNGEMDGGESMGKIISWNGADRMPDHWWSSKEATAILGSTDGTLFKPFISKEENLTVFVPELCKSLTLVYQKELDYAGVPAYRYVVTRDDFDFTLGRNKGFCHANGKKIFEEEDPSCLPSGLLDISRCQRGEPPIVISWPNFLFSADFVQKSIRGMREPDVDRDQIEVDIEPRLGAIMQARRRFQINVSMWKGINLTMPGLDLSHFRNSVVPLLEIDEHSRIDAASLEMIKHKLIYMEKAALFSAYGALIFSIIATAIVVFYAVQRKRRSTNASFIWRPKNTVSPKANGVNAPNGVQVHQSEC
ncbi:CD36 family domain-containing protein [Ditylenchus destructor]|uniref:CD36 family domain-containing protein n=1 Tax=Ditylenchus destructor TaxID=166010 RepID=A0AAD4RB51_9BILA|nr:CD36 family domain-containing protein [Ditylenchus destructor]